MSGGKEIIKGLKTGCPYETVFVIKLKIPQIWNFLDKCKNGLWI